MENRRWRRALVLGIVLLIAVTASLLIVIPVAAKRLLASPTEALMSSSQVKISKQLEEAGQWDEAYDALQIYIVENPRDPAPVSYLAWKAKVYAKAQVDPKSRFSWYRRGIADVLDAIDRIDVTPALCWEAGRLFEQLAGDDMRRELRSQFENDLALQTRLEKFVPIESANGPTGRPHVWLVARLWYRKMEACLVQGKPVPDFLPRCLFDAYDPKSSTLYALSLSDEGEADVEVVKAFREAQQLWISFGKRTYPVEEGGKEHPVDGASAESHHLRRMTGYVHFLEICRIEQLPEVRRARANLRKATELLAGDNAASHQAAGRLFESAFQTWRDVLEQASPECDPEEFCTYLEPLVIQHVQLVLHQDQVPESHPLAEWMAKLDRSRKARDLRQQ